MNALKEHLKQLGKAQLEKTIRREMDKWPPDCYGPLYQPKRPPLPSQEQQQTK